MNPLTALQKKKKKKVLHIRFWDSNKDVVATRYYSSEFLGKSSANDLCSHFEQCLRPLQKEKLLHISSDRRNLNLLFLKVRTEKPKNEELSQLIDLGTCGLHIAYNVLKHEEKASDVIYKQNNSWSTWKACWSQTCYRRYGLGKPGANTSYDHLCKAVKDCLVPVKLLFFEEVPKKLTEFLVGFQTDKPMTPFRMETLKDLIKTLMRKFRKFKFIRNKSCSEMAKLDLTMSIIRNLPIRTLPT